jgi:hypothetical protein
MSWVAKHVTRIRVAFSNISYAMTMDQVSHQYKIKGNIYVLYILVFRFLDRKREEKNILNWMVERIQNEDGSSMVHRKVSIRPPNHYMTSQPRRPRPELLLISMGNEMCALSTFKQNTYFLKNRTKGYTLFNVRFFKVLNEIFHIF